MTVLFTFLAVMFCVTIYMIYLLATAQEEPEEDDDYLPPTGPHAFGGSAA